MLCDSIEACVSKLTEDSSAASSLKQGDLDIRVFRSVDNTDLFLDVRALNGRSGST